MARTPEPPSGTRDLLGDDVRRRESAFATVRGVFERFGFEPLQTPAFERLEVLTGKYGDEGDKLIFKILRRGEQEAAGEADLALRYDLTVPLARVVANYGSRLPSPYRRYALAPVWRADRPGRGRFREFAQCDIDIVGSASPLADGEIIIAIGEALDALGIAGARFLLNSRNALHGLLDAYQMPSRLGGGVLTTLDKLDKLAPLQHRGLDSLIAKSIVADLTAEDATDRMRSVLASSERGRAGLAEIDELVAIVSPQLGADRVAFTPQLVRGLDYYTGPIWEVVAPGMPGSIASGGRYDNLVAALGGPDLPACGGSIGIERILASLPAEGEGSPRLDVAVAVLGPEFVPDVARLAAAARQAGLRTGVYLGGSGKLARQLKWAADMRARFVLLCGADEREAGQVTVRDMSSGEQTRVPEAEVGAFLRARFQAR